MDDNNIALFYKLTDKEAKEFSKLYFGLSCFLANKKMLLISKNNFIKENDLYTNENLTKSFTLRFKIIYENQVSYLLYTGSLREYQIYNKKQGISEFYEISKFESPVPDEVITLLLDAVRNNVENGEKYKNFDLLKELFDFDNHFYHFVLGSGINAQYGMPSWYALQKDFEDAVDKEFGPKTCSSMSEETFNTNYGSFQVIKDIEYNEYKSILSSMVDKAIDPTPSDDIILLAIANVLKSQKHEKEIQNVITFNYDDLLERALDSILCRYDVEFAKEDKSLMSNIIIKHTHGFLPKPSTALKNKNFNSVVLTTDEYISKYRNTSSYAYKSLYNHLDQTTCFIGNSITDYEEQKVIASHFNKNPSQFHFMFNKFDSTKIDSLVYKTIFLLKIGVIPLWFSSHDDYKNLFFGIAKKR